MLTSFLDLRFLLGYWYGWGWGWWWIVPLFFIWLVFLPPLAWGNRWYGRRYSGYEATAAAPPIAPEWESVESRFVESPKDGVAGADRVVTSMLSNRGTSFEDYRSAHQVAQKAQRGEADDRELRSAMRTFRSLYLRLAHV